MTKASTCILKEALKSEPRTTLGVFNSRESSVFIQQTWISKCLLKDFKWQILEIVLQTPSCSITRQTQSKTNALDSILGSAFSGRKKVFG